MKKYFVALLAMMLCFFLMMAASAEGSTALISEMIDINCDSVYTIALRSEAWNVEDGADVTAWFVGTDGEAAFTDKQGVATATVVDASTIEIELDAAKISGFAVNGSAELFVAVPGSEAVKVGGYTIPTLTVESDIFGSIFTGNTGGNFHERVILFDEETKATLTLSLDGLENEKIDSSNAVVVLAEGDGYYPEEFIFTANELPNAWEDGVTTYTFDGHDMVHDDTVDGVYNERAWTTLGGDGQGNFIYNLKVSGIEYNGLPVASETFRIHIFIYGRDFIYDAEKLYGDGITIEAKLAPLADPIWIWQGEGEQPILCDELADHFYVKWPESVDASTLTAQDITLTMRSQYGDEKVLEADKDYVVASSAGETQIAVVYQNLPFIPVYNTLEISIDEDAIACSGLTKVYDIASVYVYYTQFGGSNAVRSWSFYGFANLTDPYQLLKSITYVLSVEIDGETKYYAEDENGVGMLVNTADEAAVYDGNGPEDRNVNILGNHISLYQENEYNFPKYTDKQVGDQTYTFLRVYTGGKLYLPTELAQRENQTLVAAPGYVIPWGTTNWITLEKWAWQSSVDIGWNHVDIQGETVEVPYANKVPTIKLPKGTVEQFVAPEEDVVIWGLAGQESSNTTLTEDGLLTIAEDETSSLIVVYNSVPGEKFAEGAVKITVTEP